MTREFNESVSNPLGWEGDTVNCDAGSAARKVSNPLGWEGDPIHCELNDLLRTFLIH